VGRSRPHTSSTRCRARRLPPKLRARPARVARSRTVSSAWSRPCQPAQAEPARVAPMMPLRGSCRRVPPSGRRRPASPAMPQRRVLAPSHRASRLAKGAPEEHAREHHGRHLADHVARYAPPRDVSPYRERQRDDRIQMRAGNGTHEQDHRRHRQTWRDHHWRPPDCGVADAVHHPPRRRRQAPGRTFRRAPRTVAATQATDHGSPASSGTPGPTTPAAQLSSRCHK
jgi:hypothetical protein